MLHFYFLLWNMEQKKKQRIIVSHLLMGICLLLPSLYFIYPPVDSQLGLNFWVDRWSKDQLSAATRGPLFAFLPVAAWWNYHFWNTQFLIELRVNHSALRYVNLLLSVTLVVLAYFILKPNRKARLLFLANLLLCFVMGITFFSLTTERYAGFLFIGFITAYWLFASETPVSKSKKWLINGLLVVQLIGGVFIVIKDIQLPFSNADRVNELLQEVPHGEKSGTDYWAMNTIATFADRSFYCLDLQQEKLFLQWDGK
jgi:hypothetical protein